MIELFSKDRKDDNRQSSKGNQLKWVKKGYWYKADYAGYEGMAEYVVSGLLKKSTLVPEQFIEYTTEEIVYGHNKYKGCRSKDFLPEGWQMITLERLFQNYYGESLNRCIYQISGVTERICFLVENIERITGLQKFGEYMNLLLTIDAFFLNEDRHTHNIAVLMDRWGEYHYCPVFDNGASLLSDTTMDYPLEGDIEELLDKVEAKTFCRSFDEQLDVAEELYKSQIKFCFTDKDIVQVVNEKPYYSETVKNRVIQILRCQKRKYSYLFKAI